LLIVCGFSNSFFSSTIALFTDSPVESFVPPLNADLKDVMMWEDAVADLKERVRKIKTGGQALRDTIRREVRALQLLRFQTFCKFVSSS
jgi:hypothetical protein